MTKVGVSVYFPYGLTITEIFSSINGDISNNYADVWENPGHDSKEFYHFIEIARSLFRPNPSGGGSGMIIVDHSADKSITKNNVDSLDFLISLGTNESEHASTGIVRETVSVPLSKAA